MNAKTLRRLKGVTRTFRLTIIDAAGEPVDLTQAVSVKVVVSKDGFGPNANISPNYTIGGASNNIITFVWYADQQNASGAGRYTITVFAYYNGRNVAKYNWHGPDGIELVEFAIEESGTLPDNMNESANVDLTGTFSMNGPGPSAYDEWLSSPESDGWPKTVSGFLAYLKEPATEAAEVLGQVVSEKMAEVDEKMVSVQERADEDHTRAEGDHTTAAGDHTRATEDHSRAAEDHTTAGTDHQQAVADSERAASDHQRAEVDHGIAAEDHATAGSDHQRAVEDHTTATGDHTRAEQDHSAATEDHTTAGQDHQRAEQDHTTAASDHTTAANDHTRAETDHTRAEQDHTESAAATGAANEAAQTANEAAEAADAARESIEGELAKKANVEGYYGGLTAGSAENLVGRGSVEAEIQGIRTSAGQEDIGTGAAIIREVRGKSLVWNQLIAITASDISKTENGVTITDNRDGSYTVQTVETGATATVSLQKQIKNLVAGHKYYCTEYNDGRVSLRYDYMTGSGIRTATQSFNPLSYPRIRVEQGSIVTTPVTLKPIVIDLTLMFGAGNEPATPEEFERMFPLPYYEYNEGTIINNEATGLRTRGFNLYNSVTGKAVLPGKYSDYPYEYEICGTFTSISFEDYAGNVSTPELSDGRFFNVPSPGVLTVVGGNATDTCVHLVWSGWRNYGQPDYVYEPYWENTLQLNLKTITGKLNGEGESVVIFPDGARGVGPIYDRLIVDPDGFARRAIVAIGSVDMGTLQWTGSATTRYSATLNTLKIAASNSAAVGMLTIPYDYVPSGQVANNDKVISSNNGVPIGTVMLRDTAIATTVDLANTLSGVPLYFELATPLEYVLDTPIPLTYMVDDFGAEAKLPVDTAELPTGPLRFSVTYPFNAVDKLRRQRKEMIPANNFDQFLVLLGQAYGGTWNRTYNATTDDQKFTYTPPESEPTGTTDNNE